jgi:hypothetical protein
MRLVELRLGSDSPAEQAALALADAVGEARALARPAGPQPKPPAASAPAATASQRSAGRDR